MFLTVQMRLWQNEKQRGARERFGGYNIDEYKIDDKVNAPKG